MGTNESNMNKAITRTLLVGLFVALVLVGWSQSHVLARLLGGASGHEEKPAELRPTRVGALGRIEPCSEILDIDAAAGERLLTVLAKEGGRVGSGDELAHLESHDVAAAEKQEATALLEEARNRLKATEEHHQALIRVAELKLQTVEVVEPIRIDSQKSRVRSLEIDHQLADTEYVRVEKLHANATVSREEHDRKHSELKKVRELLTASKLTLAEMEADHKLALESARAAVVEAKAALELARAAIPVQSLERKVGLAEAKVQRTIIRSPIAGQVLEVMTHSGERIGKDPILKLGNTDQMHVVAEVYETDVARIRLGQSATATSSALAEPLEGTVVQIGSMIYKNDILNVDPAADADARVVEVRILLKDSSKVAGLTNLQVDVLIETASKD